jgi:hypothetical protein
MPLAEQRMSHEQFVLISIASQWFVAYRGVRVGPYANRQSALRSAIRTAEGAGADGADAEVIVELPNLERYVAWRCGRDSLSA